MKKCAGFLGFCVGCDFLRHDRSGLGIISFHIDGCAIRGTCALSAMVLSLRWKVVRNRGRRDGIEVTRGARSFLKAAPSDSRKRPGDTDAAMLH